MCAADIGSAYLNSVTREKVYIIAGPEFGPELEGKILIIFKALYGLKSSAARFHEHLSVMLRKLGFQPSRADADLWYKDMGDHYEYMARYVDDILVWSKDPMKIMRELQKTYTLKGVGSPEYYLGGNVEELGPEWEKQDVRLALSAKTYIQNVVKKNAEMLGIQEFRSTNTPMSDQYFPEEDSTPLLDHDGISKYRSLVGTANWIITLGRFDVAYAVNSLSRYSGCPHEGHLKAMMRVFGYLNTHSKGKIMIDSN